MNLRPHHALCLHFFRGKGYSQAFIENMTNIKKSLEENPEITLRCDADALCKPCPHRVGTSSCHAIEKVQHYDQAVLSLCHLEENISLSWRKLEESVQTHILQPKKREQVCGDCQWTEFCQ